jgi:hypothetical protein
MMGIAALNPSYELSHNFNVDRAVAHPHIVIPA